MKVGDKVVWLGNPKNMDHTLGLKQEKVYTIETVGIYNNDSLYITLEENHQKYNLQGFMFLELYKLYNMFPKTKNKQTTRKLRI